MLTTLACSDSLGPLNGDEGALSLRYTGAESGALSARGARPADWSTGTHSAGLRYDGYIRVFSFAKRSRGLADQFFLSGALSEPGTYRLSSDRSSGTAYAELALDASTVQNAARAIYVLISGSVTLEPNRDGRIRGSFEGTARLLTGTTTIEITDGLFNVPNNLGPPVSE